MPKSKTRKKPQQAQRPAPRPREMSIPQRLHAVNEMAVELVRDLRPILGDEQFLELRAGVLGLLITEALLTNKPDPRELTPVPGFSPPQRKEAHHEEP